MMAQIVKVRKSNQELLMIKIVLMATWMLFLIAMKAGKISRKEAVVVTSVVIKLGVE